MVARAPCWWLVVPLVAVAGAAGAQVPEYSRQDPTKIETSESCGECHVSEYEVWKRTPHATGFKTLHRSKAAETIAGKMDFFLIKRESLCLRCHYTPTQQGEELRASSGVSCESCHGAAQDWIDVHNDYGGKGLDHSNESPEHKAQRIERSVAAGMRRPSDLYPVVANCFGCHTVPEEKLVNIGGHPAGSADFELVARVEDIRHNFLESFKTGDGTDNAERPDEVKRRMYVVGRALDLEYGLRGVAAASEKGTYLSAMIRRVRIASGELRAIGRRSELPEVDEMLEAVRGVQVGLGDRDALLAAADAIGGATRRFLDRHDGTQLASLDALVSGTAEDEEGLLADVEESAAPVAAPPAGDSPPPAGVEPAAGVQTGAATAAPASTSAAVRDAVPAVGEVKTRIRPRSQHKTIGPGQCTSCHRHSPQNEWWFEDAHFRSADSFFNEDPNNVRIATFYGIRRDRMIRGDQICMDCHGTIVSGRESREINDGVSCESCHGAAADYVEPHQEGDEALGTQRPGYRKALGLGMNELKDLDVRARTCTGCHYITDPRLISSGHPSGTDFDYVGNMARIRHWESPPASDGALRAAFDRALSSRGGVPDVQLARAAGSAPGGQAPGAQAPGSPAPVSAAAGASAGGARPFRPRTPSPRPLVRGRAPSPAAVAAAEALGLPPFPEIDPSTSVEDLLLLLKERLQLLYEAVGGKP